MSQTRRELFTTSAATLAASRIGVAGAAADPGAPGLFSAAIDKLPAMLVPREKWHPFPTAAERAAWEGLAADQRTTLIAAGERSLKYKWPTLPATLFLEYVRNGNRANYERERNERRNRLRELVMAECVENKGRFIDDLVNGLWATLEESFWGVPAHLNIQKKGPGLPDIADPTVDLFGSDTGALLAWTVYLLGPALDRISPLLRERIHQETDRRILTPNLERNFWWMGFEGEQVNNWNPWINANWITAALLVERNDERRRAAIARILRSLDNFLAVYHPDGGCDEGPSYWNVAGGALFDCLELLHSATAGGLDLYREPLIQNIGRYIYKVHIYNDYFIDFADAVARQEISADLVFRYGRRIGDARMAGLGAWSARERKVRSDEGGSIGRQLPALFNRRELMAARGSQGLVRDAWFPGIQVMAARLADESPRGLYLAAKGGHNAESHNHNDVGNFIVYAEGEPVLIDAGVGTYTAKTFSAQRYDIWTMQSAYHNLPTIGGVMQKAGRSFAAREVRYHTEAGAASFALDIAGAYPAEAGVERWQRSLRLDRGANRITVREEYKLARRTPEITLSLMTPCSVSEPAAGKLLLKGKAAGVTIAYDASRLKATTEEIMLDDPRLQHAWGERLYRVLLKAENPPAEGAWELSIS